jgi:hypothetical protein
MKKNRAKHNSMQILDTSPCSPMAPAMYFLCPEVNTESTFQYRSVLWKKEDADAMPNEFTLKRMNHNDVALVAKPCLPKSGAYIMIWNSRF